MSASNAQSLSILGPVRSEFQQVLTSDALKFVAALTERFEPRRQELLKERERVQTEINRGRFPTFLPETQHVRDGNWKVAPIPRDLQDRRVEITGPVNRKMIINALNSGAKVFMADFEDATSPTWENLVDGQVNLKDAVNRTISFTGPDGKKYALNATTATLMVRPRGWHLPEYHVTQGSKPISGSLFDFGLYFFHNAKTLLNRGSGPYFYLPKMESYLEARLWADVFDFSEKFLGIPHGSIRATVLIETILASFQMDEILHELRDYSAGLNCGRWDYIFSFIKKFYEHAQFVLPDRAQVTMTQPFMNAYVQLLIKTCHRRGIHAMGGMAAQIPSNDKEANKVSLEKVKADKLREVTAGHDGTWVAHPALIPTAMGVFNEHMKGPNQIDRIPTVNVTARDLLQVPQGTISLEGLKGNVEVGILYLEGWLRGFGAIPLHNLMEDLATAEICRSQIQQWMKHGVRLSNGDQVTPAYVKPILDSSVAKLLSQAKPNQQKSITQAKEIFEKILFNNGGAFGDFMSLFAYPYILSVKPGAAKL